MASEVKKKAGDKSGNSTGVATFEGSNEPRKIDTP
jgi:hypothetical protein